MPNSITLAQQFVPILDEVYKAASVTSVLDGNPDLARAGANAGELIVPMLDMDGLADYDRNSGYVDGVVNLTNQTVACNYDRGRKFSIDNMDNQESANIAFGRLAGEFIRTKVAPEVDAFRFAAYASTDGISAAYGELDTGAKVVAALRAAATQMDEDEVPFDNRHLFITSTLLGMVKDLDTTKSKDVLEAFSSVVKVPAARFKTAIKLLSGKNTEKAGGYAAANGAQGLDFMVIHKDALIQFPKHIAPKIITPEQNQNADAYIYGYRQVGIAKVYQNKRAGVYMHARTAPSA